MATKLQPLGAIAHIQQLKDFFFVEDEPAACWTDTVQLSLSTAGDLLSLLYSNKLAILKLHTGDEGASFQLAYKGLLCEADQATSIISLSVALQQKTVGASTVILTSTWNCVAVGFSSGYLRIYTDTGTQLFEQIFHPHPIRSLKYCHPRVLQDELLLLYPDIVIAVDGFSLYQCLRFCRLQQQRSTATAGSNSAKNLNISFKKWHLQDQSTTGDVEFYGVKNTTPFEHLFQASLAGGSAQYVGQAGLGPVFNYVAVGRDPCVALYTPSEQAAVPIMSEVVMSVASKLISYLPGSSWLAGWGAASREEKVNFEPAAAITKNICIEDPRREVVSIRAAPRGDLAILTDTFGRLLLLDVNSMVLVNLWKGYRSAQCGWILVPGEGEEEGGGGDRQTLFLVIYARRRGILEVWCPYQHYRVAAFNVGKRGILLSSMYGALGEGSLSIPLTVPSWRPAKSCCFLLREDGQLLNISVPFASCFGETHLLRVEDSRVLAQLRDIVGAPSPGTGEADPGVRFEELFRQLQLASNISLVLEMVLRSEHSLEFKIRTCKGLSSEIAASKELTAQSEFVEIYRSCGQFVRVAGLYRRLVELWKGAKFLSSAAKSPLLVEVQSVLEKYFCTAQIDSSFDIPDPNTFHAAFTSRTSKSSSLEEETGLIFDPASPSRPQLVKFLSLLFLFGESPSLLLSELQSFGLSIGDIFSAFVEACLLLDIQLTSLEYQQRICETVTKTLLPAGAAWETFFRLVRNHPGICQGLVLAIYFQSVAVDSLEFETTTIEAEPSGSEGEEDRSGEWVALSPEHEQWYTTRQRLCDLLHLHINTGTPVTIDSILNSSTQSVSHVVAKHMIKHGLVQSFIDWGERCRNHSTDEGTGGGEEAMETEGREEHDDALSWLLNVLPWWPYQLDTTTISVCLVECLIFKWSADLDASTTPDMSSLVSLSKVILAVKSIFVQQALVNVLWETVFKHKLRKIHSLVEKVGRQPKDRMCQKEVGLDLVSMGRFVSLARHILANTNLSTPSPVDRFTIRQENVWSSEVRRWLLHRIVDSSSSNSLNADCLILHAQLLSTLELIICLPTKNTRPSDLFHSRHASHFFSPFTAPTSIKLSGTPDLETVREAMLRSCVKGSVGSDLSPPFETSWTALIVNLSELWEVGVGVQSTLAVLLYSLGRFTEADEVVLSSGERQSLGLQLLDVLLAQLEMLVFLDETSQKLFLPVLSPARSAWLKSKRDPSVAVLEIGTVVKTLSSVLGWVTEDAGGTVQNARALRDSVLSVL